MAEKTIIIHDRMVYSELRKQAKLNRRFTLFALVATGYMIAMKLLYDKQEKKIEELMNKDGGHEM